MSSLSGNGAKLVGNDGTVYGAALGAEVEGDGIVELAEGKYIVTAVDPTTTGWPAPASTGAAIEPGYIIEGNAGAPATPIVPETGDFYIPLTLTELCDISAWNLDFTADEIEVTTFCNDQKRYELGKTDVAGAVSGIVTVGLTDAIDEFGLARRFMDIVRQLEGDSVDLYKMLATELYVELVANDDANKADIILYFAAVNLFGFSLSAQVGGEAQTFESPLRISTGVVGATDVEVKPSLYRFSRGA